MKVLLLALLLALMATPAGAARIRHVIVIAMENTDAGEVYGDPKAAPYINRVLLPEAAAATNFRDILDLPVRSEPHYLVMEAGTRSFADHHFDSNDDPSTENSTASRDHLTRQMRDAGITWMSYQQAMGSETGACPVRSHHPYAAKHNPFVFFQDIAGNPPDPRNALCAAHHRSYAAFADDMKAGKLAQYVFVTPDLCHDMHDNCAGGRVKSGDAWLSREVPPILAFAERHDAVLFIVWDEGHTTPRLPFIAAGSGVKKGLRFDGPLNHLSLVKSVALIFGLPDLPAAAKAADFTPLFEAGQFP